MYKIYHGMNGEREVGLLILDAGRAVFICDRDAMRWLGRRVGGRIIQQYIDKSEYRRLDSARCAVSRVKEEKLLGLRRNELFVSHKRGAGLSR